METKAIRREVTGDVGFWDGLNMDFWGKKVANAMKTFVFDLFLPRTERQHFQSNVSRTVAQLERPATQSRVPFDLVYKPPRETSNPLHQHIPTQLPRFMLLRPLPHRHTALPRLLHHIDIYRPGETILHIKVLHNLHQPVQGIRCLEPGPEAADGAVVGDFLGGFERGAAGHHVAAGVEEGVGDALVLWGEAHGVAGGVEHVPDEGVLGEVGGEEGDDDVGVVEGVVEELGGGHWGVRRDLWSLMVCGSGGWCGWKAVGGFDDGLLLR